MRAFFVVVVANTSNRAVWRTELKIKAIGRRRLPWNPKQYRFLLFRIPVSVRFAKLCPAALISSIVGKVGRAERVLTLSPRFSPLVQYSPIAKLQRQKSNCKYYPSAAFMRTICPMDIITGSARSACVHPAEALSNSLSHCFRQHQVHVWILTIPSTLQIFNLSTLRASERHSSPWSS